MFHLILEGEAHLRLGHHNVTLGPGDFILLPRGTGHVVVDVNNTPPTDLFENDIVQITEHYERLTTPGEGELTTTLCGTVLFESDLTTSIVSSMPDYVLITQQSDAHQTIKAMVKAIHVETKNEAYGSELIVSKLADILILQCIRSWVGDVSKDNQNWIMAHTDKRLSRAMKQIHTDPAQKFDIDFLAQLSGMSRTSFIEYFKKKVGQPPMKYIADWRLSLARERLSSGGDPVLNIAFDVGYASESAFSRAYKTRYGESPTDTKRGGTTANGPT
jgi:AraC-like DNA-binding protein